MNLVEAAVLLDHLPHIVARCRASYDQCDTASPRYGTSASRG